MVYTIESFEKFIPTRDTFAVVGSPIAHSLSPNLHSILSEKYGVDFDYIAIDVNKEQFSDFISLAREKLCGFNLTMPFKELVLPYMDEFDDAVSVSGSANTIIVRDKKLIGFTTDGVGLCAALRLSVETLANQRVLILGCGGTARSVAAEIAQNGALVTVAVRNAQKGVNFVDELTKKCKINAFSYVSFDEIPDSFDILINATPIGMDSQDKAPVCLSNLTNLKLVYDCIYSPPMTALIKDAEKLGIDWDNGLSMLVLQGMFSERYWFGEHLNDDVVKEVILSLRAQQTISRLTAYNKKGNIALTGFMGCGKTTIGMKLASLLNMHFLDLDAKIEAEQGMKISDIFDKYGEVYFRTLEKKACLECKNLKNTIISTGGGTIINNENSKILKENCLVVFLDRSLEQIEKNLEGSTSRPLLNVENMREHINSLYALRRPQYIERADISVTFKDNDINSSLERILFFI